MSMDGSIDLDWGDDTHRFRLAIDELRGLEESRQCGTAEIHNRLSTGRWYVDDIREVIRFGLIGGGKTPIEALNLARTYVDDRPKAENVLIASAILMAALVGPSIEDEPEQDPQDNKKNKPERTSPKSTATVQ